MVAPITHLILMELALEASNLSNRSALSVAEIGVGYVSHFTQIWVWVFNINIIEM